MAGTCPIPECSRPIRKAGMCDTCYARHKRNGLLPDPQPTPCETCGTVIVPTSRKPRRFCSMKCLADHHNPRVHAAERAARAARPRPRCARCGVSTAHRKQINARFCSLRCLRTYNSTLRRALARGVDADRFDHIEVFERDRWTCGLCGEAVERGLSGLDPMGPTLDHVVPIARGGAHTMANTQLAHRRCNTVKGARRVG